MVETKNEKQEAWAARRLAEPRFVWEKDSDNVLTVVVHGKPVGEWDPEEGLEISVSEEQAVDSYNQNFECTIRL
jgi:hypothetical protein